MRNILLATDLGSNSDRAVERALKLAKDQDAKLHVINVAPAYKGSKTAEKDRQADIENLIKGHLSDYKGTGKVVTSITVKLGGDAFFEILEAAYARKADLIVMGMHGKEKLRDLFVGTTIERVIRKGVKPVLMVKNKPTGDYKDIMSAVDFAPASRDAMRCAMEIAPKAMFNVAHIYNMPVYYGDILNYDEIKADTEKAQRAIMDAFLKTEKSYFSKTYKGSEKKIAGQLFLGQPADLLIKQAKTLKADLMTIGTHSQPGFTSKLGGVAADILSRPPCDVLVAPAKLKK